MAKHEPYSLGKGLVRALGGHYGKIDPRKVMSDTYQYTSIFPPEPFDIGHFSEDTYILDRLPEVYRMELPSSSMFLLVFFVVILKKRVGDREALRHRRWDRSRDRKDEGVCPPNDEDSSVEGSANPTRNRSALEGQSEIGVVTPRVPARGCRRPPPDHPGTRPRARPG